MIRSPVPRTVCPFKWSTCLSPHPCDNVYAAEWSKLFNESANASWRLPPPVSQFKTSNDGIPVVLVRFHFFNATMQPHEFHFIHPRFAPSVNNDQDHAAGSSFMTYRTVPRSRASDSSSAYCYQVVLRRFCVSVNASLIVLAVKRVSIMHQHRLAIRILGPLRTV